MTPDTPYKVVPRPALMRGKHRKHLVLWELLLKTVGTEHAIEVGSSRDTRHIYFAMAQHCFRHRADTGVNLRVRSATTKGVRYLWLEEKQHEQAPRKRGRPRTNWT
jgi:hypothetical protein